MPDDRLGELVDDLIPRLLAYTYASLPSGVERQRLAEQLVYEAFEQILERGAPNLEDPKALFRTLCRAISERAGVKA